MNEELQSALATILNKTIEATGQAASFLEAEIPDVIRQLLTWKLAESLVILSIATAVIAACVIGAVKVFKLRPAPGSNIKGWAWRSFREGDNDVWAEPGGVMFLICALFFAFVGALVTIANLLVAVQIWLAPKVYLIEYAASLAK